MTTLHTPLTTDDDGTLIDANGHEIADLWVLDEHGRMRVNDANEAAMRERAAEIVMRCNAHEELVEALRYLGNEQNWIDCDDGLTLVRHGGGRQEGIFLYSHDIKPWAFLRDILAKLEAR